MPVAKCETCVHYESNSAIHLCNNSKVAVEVYYKSRLLTILGADSSPCLYYIEDPYKFRAKEGRK